jgi:sugar lactone lactonase YvrE
VRASKRASTGCFRFINGARLGCVLLLAVGLAYTPAAVGQNPTSYQLPGNAVYPEGIAFQARTGSFFVSSTTDGTIFRGRLAETHAQVFLAPGQDGRTAAVGLKVSPRGLLYVAGGATGLIFVYDAATRALVGRFDTGPAPQRFLNDIAIAPNGDAYVTDSMRPILYRIPFAAVRNRSATTQTAEPWLNFAGTPLQYTTPGVNLNGIVATNDGRYLIVAQTNTAKLFRITIATKSVAEVNLGGVPVAADGLLLQGRTLLAVARPDIAKVILSADLLHGMVLSRTNYLSLRFPTTIARARNRLLVVNSQFDRRAPGLSPALPFTVSSVPVP